MRLLAHYSGDEKLCQTFLNDEDSHGATAVNMFSLPCTAKEAKKLFGHLRQIAKVINFLLMYGGGASTLYDTLAKEDAVDEEGNPITLAKSKEYYALYFDTYVGVKEFKNNQIQYAHKHEVVRTLLGRKRHLTGINDKNRAVSAYWERTSINSPIQGSAGDVMIAVQPVVEDNQELKELNASMRMQVHDELVLVCPKKNKERVIEIMKDIMANPFDKPLRVPLRADADWGLSYAEAK